MNTLDILKAMRSIYVIEEGMHKDQEVEITHDLKIVCGGTSNDNRWNGEWSEPVDYTKYSIQYRGNEIGTASGSAFDVLEASISALDEVLAEAQANQRG